MLDMVARTNLMRKSKRKKMNQIKMKIRQAFRDFLEILHSTAALFHRRIKIRMFQRSS